MVMEDGLWVHDRRPEAGADWERVIEDGCEARIESAIRTPSAPIARWFDN